MGIILNEKMYPCRIETSGVIFELGCISGPVPFCRLTREQINMLVMNGRKVFEKNPKNLDEEVRVTLETMHIRPFEEQKITKKDILQPEKVEKMLHPVEKKVEEPVNESKEVEETPSVIIDTGVPSGTDEEPDLSKMSAKQRKKYLRNKQAQQNQEQSGNEDPIAPDM